MTARYNLGRLLEETHQLTRAEAVYHEVLVACPDYADARLRLGVMDQRRGNIMAALKKFESCIRLVSVHACVRECVMRFWWLLGCLVAIAVNMETAVAVTPFALVLTKRSPIAVRKLVLLLALVLCAEQSDGANSHGKHCGGQAGVQTGQKVL